VEPGDTLQRPDDDDDDDSISSSDVFFTLGMALALIIILGCITFAVVAVLVIRKKNQEEEEQNDRVPEDEFLPDEDKWDAGGQVEDLYDDPQDDEWSDLEHSQESEEGYMDDLEDEALQFDKPSDFELSMEEMLERLNERYESGEIDQETYDIIYEALQGDNTQL